MARVELARAAIEDLDRLVAVLSLSTDTRDRVRRSLAPLAELPRLGPELTGRWTGMRFLLGPWRWMLLVYDYDELRHRVGPVVVRAPFIDADCRTQPAKRSATAGLVTLPMALRGRSSTTRNSRGTL